MVILAAVLALTGCSGTDFSGEPGMYPDYRGVTVPCNIAPLNFYNRGEGARKERITFTAGSSRASFRGSEVHWNPDSWKRILSEAAGDSIYVHSSRLGDWAVAVSTDSADRYLTYRLIEPGYEVWDEVEIRERDITSWDERVLASHTNTGNSCMNCHIHKGSSSMFYLRGPKGGAILNRGGHIRKLNLRTEGMVSSTVYGDLSPDGRWGVFSTNIIIPGFHATESRRMEIFDTASDLCLADFDGNRMIVPDALSRKDIFETFPCFNADGDAIFYCAADTVEIPEDIEKLMYSLYKVGFDQESGETGAPELIWDAKTNAGSVCHPKASPDGRWLLFTVADYGTFPIWHRECGLHMMDLSTGESRSLDEVNSDRSDTYHSWSTNSRWFVFASKRGDGQYGKPYICHVDENGSVSKPFLLPQEDPHHYDMTLKSYNIPDFGAEAAPYDTERTGDILDNMDAEDFN